MHLLKKYLKQHHRRFVRELCDYLRLPSVSADSRYLRRLVSCAKWMSEHCRRIGLETELCPTRGNPIILARTPLRPGPRKPHYLVYGHYDVQPPDPLELWKSPPFQPRLRNGSVVARGASDNKGQHFAHLKAVEAYLKTGTELPCDLTFVIEGEEEVGSPSFAKFLQKHRNRLRCDGVVISDSALYGPKYPTLSYGLRGICGLEITLRGPQHDVHSGMFGGSIENPAMALCQMLARLRNPAGQITIPGFYQEVLPLSPFERANFLEYPFAAAAYKQALGVPELFGESGFTPIEQRGARPTLEINGLTSGYQGEGSKTIIPAWARAKLTMRLVPHQQPDEILAQTIAYLKEICPRSVRMEIKTEPGGEPYLISPECEQVRAALNALREAFGNEPLLAREGGSIPIVHQFKEVLKTNVLLVGLGLPDDNPHSPNEKFDLDIFAKGMLMSALLWQHLTETSR